MSDNTTRPAGSSHGYRPPIRPVISRWMDLPKTEIPNCPPGLEYLANLNQLLVAQQLEHLEMFTRIETENRYVVKNKFGEKIYYIRESSDFCIRNSCGACRPFDMHIWDKSGNFVMHLYRPLACHACCCFCCLQLMEVYSPPGTLIGTIEQKWSLWFPNFEIKNAADDVLLRIMGPFFTMSCCCNDVRFQITSADGEVELGFITKHWSGLLREFFSDADYFGISFPMNLDVQTKAILLGACMLICFQNTYAVHYYNMTTPCNDFSSKKTLSKSIIELDFNTMEGVITTISGLKRPAASPTCSPRKKTNFMGISPLNDLMVKTPTDRPFRVSIEGNIGAGKSTLIKHFQGMEGIETFAEPIDWWRNVDGHNLLDLMYTDINEWLRVFQSYVQFTRLSIQTTQPKNSTTTVQMFERSIQNNRFCFMEQAHDNGYLHGADYAVLDQWYRWIRANVDISLDLIVYLRSSPKVVYERVKARGRPEESGLSFEYLKQLHDSHEKWLMSNNERFNTIPVLVLDADKTLDEIIEQYKANEHKILGYDKKGIKKVDPLSKEKVKKTLDL